MDLESDFLLHRPLQIPALYTLNTHSEKLDLRIEFTFDTTFEGE